MLLGDLNTVSPEDALCLEREGALAGLLAPGAPPHLLPKYTCTPQGSPGCLEAYVEAMGGASGAYSDPAAPLLDFRPLQLLLSSRDGGGEEGGLALSDLLWRGGEGLHGAPGAACPASYPTAFIAARAGVPVDGHDDNAHVPLRLDYALGNAAFKAAHPGLACSLGGFHFSSDGHAVEAGSGRVLSAAQAHLAFQDMLLASDHLPVVCE